jgi:hypothetical protein
MSRIQEKASESEAIVKNITKDIQILDLAKKNLMLSMTSTTTTSIPRCVYSLRNTYCVNSSCLLVNEMAQLESLIRENKYHDIVHAYGVRVSPPVPLRLGFNPLTQFSRRSNNCP